MKKWRIILSSILAVAAVAACGAAVGCKDKTDGEHSHTYGSKWSYSRERHWKAATCGHEGERSQVAKHDFGSDDVCKVCGYKAVNGGLLMSKETTQYELNASQGITTANIVTTDITVTDVDKDGTETVLQPSEYTLEYYKGDEKIKDISNATNGTYNIWATTKSNGQIKEAFVVVYVIDNVVSFERDTDSLNSAARTQELGLDVISDKWNFIVTYASGIRKTVNVSDEHVERNNFSTFIERQNASSTVTYTEVNAIGQSISKATSVTYTITKNPNSNIVYHAYDFDAFGDKWLKIDKVTLEQKDFVDTNEFITLIGGTAQYRGNSNKVLEIRGDTLSVDFTGIGLLQIGARSTGNSQYSAIAVVDEDGNYVAATYANATNVRPDDDLDYYAVTGDGATLEFTISKPGTYKIVTVDEVIFNGDALSTARFTRILSLSTTDVPLAEGVN